MTLTKKKLEGVRSIVPEKVKEARKPLEVKLKSLERKLKIVEAEVAQKRGVISGIEKERILLKQRVAKEVKEKQGQREELRRLEKKVAGLKAATPKRLAEAKAPLIAKIEELESSVSGLTKEKKREEQEKEQLVQVREKLSQELTLIKKKLEGVRSIVPEKIKEARKPLEVKLESLQNELKNSKALVLNKNTEIEVISKERNAFKKEQGLLRKQKDALKMSLIILEKNLKKRELALPLKIAQAKKTFESKTIILEKKLKTLERRVGEKINFAQELEKERNSLTKTIQKQDQERQKKEEELKVVKQKMLEVKKSIPRQIKKVEVPLLEKVQNLENKGKKLKVIISGMENDIKAVFKQKDALNQELAVLRKEKGSLESTVERLGKNLRRRESDAPVKIAQARKPLEDTIVDLEKKLVDMKNSIPKQLSVVKSPLIQEIQNLKKELRSSNLFVQAKISQNNILVKDKDVFKHDLQEAEKNIQILEEKLNSAKKAMPIAMVKARKPLEEELAVFKRESENSKRLVKIYTLNVKGLNKNIDVLKKELEKEKGERKSVRDKFVSIQGELAEVKKSLPTEIAKAKKPLKDQILRFQEKIVIHKNIINQRGIQLKDADKLRISLLKNLEVKANTIESLNKNLDFVKAKFAQMEKDTPLRIASVRAPLQSRVRELEQILNKTQSNLNKKEIFSEQLSRKQQALFNELEKTQRQKDEFYQNWTEVFHKLKKIEEDFPNEILKVKKPLEASVRFLEKKLVATEGIIKQKEVENKGLLGTQASLKQELVKAEEVKNVLNDKIARIQNQRKNFESGIPEKISNSMRPLEQKIRSLDDKFKRSKEILNQKEEIISSLNRQKVNLTLSLNKVKLSLVSSHKALEGVEAEMRNTQNAIPQKISKAREPLLEEVAQLKAFVKSMKNSLKDEDVKSREMKGTNESLKKELDDTIAQKKRLKEKVDLGEIQIKTFNKSFPLQIAQAKEPLVSKIKALEKQLSETVALVPRKIEQARKPLASKIKNLEESLKIIEAKTVKKNMLIGKIEKEKSLLKRQIEKQVQEQEKRSEELMVFKKKLSDIEASIPDRLAKAKEPLERKIDLFNMTLNKKENRIGALQRQLEGIQQQYSNAEKESQEVMLTKIELDKNYNSLQEKFKIMQKSHPQDIIRVKEPLQNEIVKLQGTLSRYEDVLKNLKKKQAAVIKAKSELQKKYEHSENKNTVLSQEKKEIKSLKNKEILDIKKLLQDKIAFLEKDSKGLRGIIDQYAIEQKKLSKKRDTLKNELKKNQDERGQSESKQKELQIRLSELERSIPNKINEGKAPLQNRIIQLEKQTNGLQQKLNEFNSKTKNLSKESNVLRGSLLKVQEERNVLLTKQGQLQNQLSLLEKSIPVKISEERVPLQNKIVKLEQELERSKKNIDQKEGLMDSLDKKYKSLAKDFDSLLLGKKSLEKVIFSLTGKVKRLEQETSKKVKASRQPLQKKIKNLQVQLKEMEQLHAKNIEAVKVVLNQKSREIRANEVISRKKEGDIQDILKINNVFKNQLTEMNQEKINLSRAIKKLQEKLKAYRETLPQKIAQAGQPFKEKIISLKNNLEHVNQEAGEKQLKIIALEKEKKEIKGTQFLLQNENKRMNKDLILWKERIKTIESDLSVRVAAAKASLQEKLSVLQERIIKEKKLMNKKIKEAKEPLEKKIKGLNEELERSRLGMNQKNVLLKGLQKNKDKIKVALAEAQEKGSVLNKELESVQIEHQSALASLKIQNNKIEVLKETENTIRNAFSKMEAEKNLLDGNVKNLLDQIQKMKDSLPGKMAEVKTPLLAEIQVLSTKNTELRGSIRNKIEQSIQPFKGKIEQLERELQLKKDKIIEKHLDFKKVVQEKENLSKKNSRLQNTQKELESKVSNLYLERKKIEQLVGKKESSLEALKKEHNIVQKELESTKKDRIRLEQELRALSNTIGDLRKAIPQKISAISGSFQEKIGILEREKQELKELTQKKITKNKEALKKEIRFLKNSLQQKTALEKKKNDAIKELQQIEIKQSQESIDSGKKISALNKEVEGLRRIQKNSQNQLRDKNTEMKNLRSQRDAVKQELEIEENERIILDAQIAELSSAMKKLRISIFEKVATAKVPLEQKIKILEEKSGKFALALKEKNEKIENLGVIKLNMDETVSEFQKKYKQLMESLKGVEIKYNSKIKELKNKDSQIVFLQKNRNIFQENLSKVQGEHGKLERKNSQLLNDIKNLRASIAGKISSIKDPLEKKVQSLEKKLKEMQALTGEKELVVKELQRKQERLNQNLAMLSNDSNHLNEELKRTKNVKKSLESLVEKKGSNIKKIREQYKEVQKKLELLQAERNVLTEQNQQLSQDIHRTKASLQKKLSLVEAPLRKKIRELELAEKNRGISIEERVAESRLPLKKKIQSLGDQLKKTKALVEEKEAFLKDINREYGVIKKELEVSQDKKEAYIMKVRQLEGTLRKNKQTFGSRLVLEKKDIQKNMKVLEEELRRLKVESTEKLKNSRFSFELRIRTLENSLAVMEQKITNKEQIVARLSSEKEGFSDRFSEIKKEKKVLENALGTLMEKFKETESNILDKIALVKQPLESEIRELKSQSAQDAKVVTQKIRESNLPLEKEIKDLSEKLKAAGNLLAKKESRVSSLSGQIDKVSKELLEVQETKRNTEMSMRQLEQKSKNDNLVSQDKFKKERYFLQKQIQELTNKIKDMDKKMKQKLRDKNSFLKNKIRDMGLKLKTSQMVVSEKEDINTELKKKKKALEEQLTAVRKKSNALQEAIYALTEKLNLTRDNFNARLDSEQKRTRDLESRLSGQGTNLGNLKSEVRDALELLESGK